MSDRAGRPAVTPPPGLAGMAGIDAGGAFADFFHAGAPGRPPRVRKAPSTPDGLSRGPVEALRAAGVGAAIATNAAIEREGARRARIATEGFRDVLEPGRRDRRRRVGLAGAHPRLMRREVAARMDRRGAVPVPPDEPAPTRLADALAAEGVEAVVVSFPHANPAHQRRAREILPAANPDREAVIATDMVREYREVERTSAAVAQGRPQPLAARHARGLTARPEGIGRAPRTLVMRSNGGLAPLEGRPAKEANIARSGPSARVTAAARIAAEAGFDDVAA